MSENPPPSLYARLLDASRRRTLMPIALLALGLGLAQQAWAFCGFYVAQASSSLFNESSQVVLARDGEQTTLTMANDYKGNLSEFSIVIPVPVPVKKTDVRVVDKGAIDRVDAYSAPRMAEYHDPDPCPDPAPRYPMSAGYASRPSAMMMDRSVMAEEKDEATGVRILDSYTVGEYDILILSAEDSGGLVVWLNREGYKMPERATPILQSYIAQKMTFFVAKVNLKEKRDSGSSFLRPLQVSYKSPKFMLPIRLGMLNAEETQDLFIYTLTKRGRVETTNYRTIKVPTDAEIPPWVRTEFSAFYKDMFSKLVQRDGMSGVYTEYGWPLTIACDPCSADPITVTELQSLGVPWVTEQYGNYQQGGYLTRLHVRYDLDHFPEDLVFQETADQQTFQGRYVIRHPFNGDTSCSDGRTYEKQLAARQEKEAQTLGALTGWDMGAIRRRTPARANPVKPTPPPPPATPEFWRWE